ncbi:MAG: DUF2911 domain-containing protein [Acidobacteria bacterium]|nr:DUF2911 domain-containing protein [Acidobacteriota bacterium]
MTPGTGGSPPKLTEVKFGDKDVWIVYHAPSVKGRKIFDGEDALQKPGTIWRLGADQATFLHTDADLDINGLKVPKGEYTLYMDLDQGKWQLVVSKQTGQWGIGRGGTSLKESEAVGRAAMTMSRPASLVEQLEIKLASTGSGKGKLTVEWEHVSASVNFTAQ